MVGLLHVVEVEFGHTHLRLGGGEAAHIGYDFHHGDDLALLDLLAGLLKDFGDDARHLGLQSHLLARVDLSGDHRSLLDGVDTGLHDLVNDGFRFRFLVEIHEGPNNPDS